MQSRLMCYSAVVAPQLDMHGGHMGIALLSPSSMEVIRLAGFVGQQQVVGSKRLHAVCSKTQAG